jgi:5-oxoprolinase (ATP-hydrolysing)
MGDAGRESQQAKLGVDVGGTFTDIYLSLPDGETVRAKVLTTPEDQSIGIKNGIDQAKATAKQRHGWTGTFEFIHHGTTTATNAILEGKGATTGLIVTAGHKDILAIRRSQIPGHLGAWLMYNPPEPVVPLERTIQCYERMSVTGETVRKVDVEALKSDIANLKRQKPKAIAISLLNSYASDKHEKEVAAVLKEEFGPEVDIICSSDVLREAGEYERSVTTAANALVMPVVKNYLSRLAEKLKEDSGTVRILKSDGGLTSLEVAGSSPVSILMSGPAGGVKGAADAICRSTKYMNLVTLDMGGTSTDCAIVHNGSPQLRRETVIGELSVRSPAIDVKTVGAGGGSIATYMELTETLRVGPESSGAVPGPACYGKGGTQATVTDANLVLGYLPQKLLGGEFVLDVEAAKTAVGKIAKQMNISLEQAANDIIDIVNENMFGTVRNVSVEQGFDARDFAFVAFGGAGPMHANAIGKLLGAWPVIIPPAPGVLCAQGDATTKLSHESSESYIRLLSDTSVDEVRPRYEELKNTCIEVMKKSIGHDKAKMLVAFETDLRYKGQALTLTVDLDETEIGLDDAKWKETLRKKFDAAHEQQFTYSLDHIELEIMRVGARVTDGSEDLEVPTVAKATSSEPPEDALVQKQTMIFDGKTVEADIWNRAKISKQGIKVKGPCVITEMDSNTLVLPGFVAEIDHIGNILISPETKVKRDPPNMEMEAAKKLVSDMPLIPTLIASTLAAVREEMDTMMLRTAMSPAIREQQDEFNVITTPEGKMLVGQFGSFVGLFLDAWTGTIEEGDVFVTNDVYMIKGAVSHLNDVIVLWPIFWNHQLIGWSSQFGHLTDVGGKVAGSMSIGANSIYDDGVQIPLVKLYAKGKMNDDLVNLLVRNSREPDWYRSDLTAIVASCRTAAGRVCELVDRFGLNVYKASTNELLQRNKVAMGKIIDTMMTEEPHTFTDFVDDDGHGNGPWAVTCTLVKTPEGKMRWDWSGTSPQSEHSINYYFSEVMFKMFIGYYLIAAAAPGTVINDGFHDLLEVYMPEGSLLKPVRPAPVSWFVLPYPTLPWPDAKGIVGPIF